MMQEVSDLQKKRAYNLIWNAAADYTFAPDFKFYTEEGNADIYWNSILGLARKHYDYEQLKNLFRSLETEEEAGEYESLLWLGPGRQRKGNAACPARTSETVRAEISGPVRRGSDRRRPLLRLSGKGALQARSWSGRAALPL